MARSKPRTAGPIKRTIVAPPPSPHPSSITMLRSPVAAVTAPGPVRRSTALPLTATQRDSQGKRSDWNRAAELRPWTTPMTSAWSPTHSTMPRGGVTDPTAYPTTR